MGTAEGTKELGSDVVMVRKLKYCYYKERTAVGAADQKTNNEELLVLGLCIHFMKLKLILI